MSQPIKNAMTVDVEDYYHVTAFAATVSRTEWSAHQSRVERNTAKVLDLFDRFGVKATFFVLGWVAERFPGLVREIAVRGHEVACHGYDHKLIYEQSEREFRDETWRAKEIIEGIVSRRVWGYRAASYSITDKSLWALEVLHAAGFVYDSSIFPIRHDNYGIHHAPTEPYRHTTEKGAILEFPLTTIRRFGMNFPAAGGGYFRILPYQWTRSAIAALNARGRSCIFYFHPWEIDPEQPRLPAGWRSRFRHYTNLGKFEARLIRLLNEFRFTTVREVLEEAGLWPDAGLTASTRLPEAAGGR